jgi:hypothetical protein
MQLPRQLEPLLTVARQLNREAGTAQVERQQVDRVLVVLDDEDRGLAVIGLGEAAGLGCQNGAC